MAGRSENAFEVLSRDEAAPEVENPAVLVTDSDVKAGLAKHTGQGVPHVAAAQVGRAPRLGAIKGSWGQLGAAAC